MAETPGWRCAIQRPFGNGTAVPAANASSIQPLTRSLNTPIVANVDAHLSSDLRRHPLLQRGGKRVPSHLATMLGFAMRAASPTVALVYVVSSAHVPTVRQLFEHGRIDF